MSPASIHALARRSASRAASRSAGRSARMRSALPPGLHLSDRLRAGSAARRRSRRPSASRSRTRLTKKVPVHHHQAGSRPGDPHGEGTAGAESALYRHSQRDGERSSARCRIPSIVRCSGPTSTRPPSAARWRGNAGDWRRGWRQRHRQRRAECRLAQRLRRRGPGRVFVEGARVVKPSRPTRRPAWSRRRRFARCLTRSSAGFRKRS